MSNDLPQEFKYLVLFAALSGSTFTKSDLGIDMKIGQLDCLIEETRLLEVRRRGNSRQFSANRETLRWAEEHLNDTDESAKNKAVMAILHLIQAKTVAYLRANHISMETYLRLRNQSEGSANAAASPEDPHPADTTTTTPEGRVDAVRRAYLSISGGAYDTRVLLKDLRRRLTLPRDAQDAVFFEMIRSGEADFYPEDDPMSRNEEDEQSALLIADRRRHLVYLHRDQRS